LIKLKNCHVTGIDLEKSDVDTASKKLNKAIVGDINDEKLINKLDRYDIIIFADVIEHLPNPSNTLKNIKNLLKDNGMIIFSIPHMAHVSVRIDLLNGKFPYSNRGLLDKTHFIFMTKTS
jgi:2-polyprenyl-3-methyl-5-hydroxy-6-metoxy-1,4-benzoquinol methylase